MSDDQRKPAPVDWSASGSVRVGIRIPRAVHEALRHRIYGHESRSLSGEILGILTGARPPLAFEHEAQASRAFFASSPGLAALAEAQGISPATDVTALMGDFWPTDESTDEFLETLQGWRLDDEGRMAS